MADKRWIKWFDWEWAIFWFVVLILVLLFGGEPDIQDAIVHRLMK